MRRVLSLCLLLASVSLFAQSGGPAELVGTLEGRTYISPTGTFRMAVPVLPELGGRIVDTENVVTFQDDFNLLYTVAAFPMDATLRWEFSTRGTKDFLTYFFSSYVMPDLQQTLPGARVEKAVFAPSTANGALIAYMLLPGGSMFAHKLAFAPGDAPPEAKRGNLIFVREGWVYLLSSELAERVLERSAYKKTTAEEDDLLRARLVELLGKIEFTKPAVKPAP